MAMNVEACRKDAQIGRATGGCGMWQERGGTLGQAGDDAGVVA